MEMNVKTLPIAAVLCLAMSTAHAAGPRLTGLRGALPALPKVPVGAVVANHNIAGFGNGQLAGLSVASSGVTGNGGLAGVAIRSGNFSGNGRLVGIAAASGTGSGYGRIVSLGVANAGQP